MTRVWEDPWVPNNPRYKPLPKLLNAIAVMVEDLIDPILGNWDVDALATIFVPTDVEMIQRTLMGRINEDTWAWQLERHGNSLFDLRTELFWQPSLTQLPQAHLKQA